MKCWLLENEILHAALLCDTVVWREKKDSHASLLCDTEVWSGRKRDTACCATLWYCSVKRKKDSACFATLWYWSVKWKKTLHAALLCDTEVWSGNKRHRVILKCNCWKKGYRMLRYFVILKCEVKKDSACCATLWYWSVKRKKGSACCSTMWCWSVEWKMKLHGAVYWNVKWKKERHRVILKC